jgi:hypothetical protein
LFFFFFFFFFFFCYAPIAAALKLGSFGHVCLAAAATACWAVELKRPLWSHQCHLSNPKYLYIVPFKALVPTMLPLPCS